MYKFKAYGHENLLSTHRNTVEFTREKHLTKKGDCILGINADFDAGRIKELIRERIRKREKKVRVLIQLNGLNDEITADINPNFCSRDEMVIRKTAFLSERTFAVNADKAAIDIIRGIAGKMKNPAQHIDIFIY